MFKLIRLITPVVLGVLALSACAVLAPSTDPTAAPAQAGLQFIEFYSPF